MSQRATVLTVRITSLLTLFTLVWAWHFLMAIVATTESRTPTPIMKTSTELTTTTVAFGRRNAQHTREIDARPASSLSDLSLLHRKAAHERLRAHSLAIASFLIGALVVCLLIPVRSKRVPGTVVELGLVDRKAA